MNDKKNVEIRPLIIKQHSWIYFEILIQSAITICTHYLLHRNRGTQVFPVVSNMKNSRVKMSKKARFDCLWQSLSCCWLSSVFWQKRTRFTREIMHGRMSYFVDVIVRIELFDIHFSASGSRESVISFVCKCGKSRLFKNSRIVQKICVC